MHIKKDISKELALILRIRDEVDTLATILDEEHGLPSSVSARLESVSSGLARLYKDLLETRTYIVFKDNETEQENTKYFSEGDYGLFTEASRYYAFADLDDTFSVVKIVFKSREVAYCGWDFGMHFKYKYKDNNEIAFENWYPQWDH